MNKDNLNQTSSKRVYVHLQFCEQSEPISALFDTGAAVSLLSIKDFNLAKQAGTIINIVKDHDIRLTNASGNNMQVQCVANIGFFINGSACNAAFVISGDLHDHSIIGMNIIRKYNLIMDPMGDTVRPAKQIQVAALEGNKMWKIISARKVTIQAREAKLVRCRIVDEHGVSISASKEFMANLDLISAAVISDSNGNFSIYMPNAAYDCEKEIAKGEKVGEAHPLSDYEPVTDDEVLLKSNIDRINIKQDRSKQDIDSVKQALWGNIRETVPEQYQNDYFQALAEQQDAFSASRHDIGYTERVTHNIRVRDNEPVYCRQFRLPLEQLQLIKEHVAAWLADGVIEQANSPYNAPIFCVPKKEGMGLRCVLDYRRLNAKSLPDKYSIRTIDQCLAEVGRARSQVFSCLDATSGFWQMKLKEEARPYTAFTLPGVGQFQWVTTPMGLMGAPASFSRLMDLIMREASNVITYIDDVLVHSKNHKDHIGHLISAVKLCKQSGLKLNPAKCIFGTNEITYLGHTLTENGVLPGKDKTEALLNIHAPRNQKEVKSFIGLANYFRGFVKHFAVIAAPLFKLTRNASEWKEGTLPEEAMKSFHTLRDCITSTPVLRYPKAEGEFHLFVDAALGDKVNEGGLGACLMQTQENGHKHPVGYASRRLLKHEKNYPAFLAEMQAAVFGMEHFDAYLRGKRFILYTDHKPMCKLGTVHTKTLNRLQLKMQDMFPEIRYVDGKENTIADFLSRYQGLGGVGRVDASQFRVRHLQMEDDTMRPWLVEAQQRAAEAGDGEDITIRRPGVTRPLAFMNGVLKVKLPKRKGVIQIDDFKVLAPPKLQKELIGEAHNSLIGGHGGTFKTKERIREDFWWPGMDDMIQNHINHCTPCQANNKAGQSKNPPLQQLPACSAPSQRIHIDLFGPIKSSKSSNNFILVITDAFTKLVQVTPVKSKDARGVAQALLDKYIHIFGVPKVIHSDQGTEFCNELQKAIWDSLNIDHSVTSPYHPQCNAQAEIFNKTMAKFLRTAIYQAEKSAMDWELFLSPMMFSYNTAVHSSTRVTPFYATFGYDPRVPLWDKDFNDEETDKNIKKEKYAAYLAKLRHTQHTAHKVVHHNNQEHREQQQRQHDKDVVFPTLEAGDKVWCRIPISVKGPNPKLQESWEPGTIIERKGIANYKVRRENRKKRKSTTLNIQQLKPRKEEEEDLEEQESDDSDPEDEEDVDSDNAEEDGYDSDTEPLARARRRYFEQPAKKTHHMTTRGHGPTNKVTVEYISALQKILGKNRGNLTEQSFIDIYKLGYALIRSGRHKASTRANAAPQQHGGGGGGPQVPLPQPVGQGEAEQEEQAAGQEIEKKRSALKKAKETLRNVLKRKSRKRQSSSSSDSQLPPTPPETPSTSAPSTSGASTSGASAGERSATPTPQPTSRARKLMRDLNDHMRSGPKDKAPNSQTDVTLPRTRSGRTRR